MGPWWWRSGPTSPSAAPAPAPTPQLHRCLGSPRRRRWPADVLFPWCGCTSGVRRCRQRTSENIARVPDDIAVRSTLCLLTSPIIRVSMPSNDWQWHSVWFDRINVSNINSFLLHVGFSQPTNLSISTTWFLFNLVTTHVLHLWSLFLAHLPASLRKSQIALLGMRHLVYGTNSPLIFVSLVRHSLLHFHLSHMAVHYLHSLHYPGASIPQRPWCVPPKLAEWVPQFLIIMHLKCCADRYDMTFMSFDNHVETKVLFSCILEAI